MPRRWEEIRVIRDNVECETLAERIGLFEGLSAEDVAGILARGMTIRVGKGETVFHKGSYGSQLYVILSGRFAVRDGDKTIAMLRTGDTFGEMSVINREPRSASVEAIDDSRLFVLTETTFKHLLAKRISVQILLNIVRILSRRLREANKRIAPENMPDGGAEHAPGKKLKKTPSS